MGRKIFKVEQIIHKLREAEVFIAMPATGAPTGSSEPAGSASLVPLATLRPPAGAVEDAGLIRIWISSCV